jgi:hypothetical protein
MPLEMDPEIRARWTAALRSGEIPQVESVLNDGQGRCCLGVLCDIAVADGVVPEPVFDDLHEVWSYIGSYQLLPDEVTAWAGFTADDLDEGDPVVTVQHRDREAGVVAPFGLAELNDDGWTFGEIADAIDGGEA